MLWLTILDGKPIGWTCQCSVLYAIHIYWCKICYKRVLANQDWRFLPVSLIFNCCIIYLHIRCILFSFVFVWCFTSYLHEIKVMQIVRMVTGQDTLPVGQLLNAMSDFWVAIIWYDLYIYIYYLLFTYGTPSILVGWRLNINFTPINP